MKFIKSKEELEERINFLKKVYSKEIIDYYESLLNLEISSLNKKYIREDILEELKSTTIYNDISRFNIYNHALNTLDSNSKFKRLYSRKESIDVITPNHIKDYKVYTYDPSKDEVILYDLIIDEIYRKSKIDDIKRNRIELLDKQIDDKQLEIISNSSLKELQDLRIEKEQLESAKDIALLEIKALSDRIKHEDYANEVRNTILGVNNIFSNFYNLEENTRISKIANTKVRKHTYHY
jgi:ribosomal protein L20A (L18A)